jgi:hypothetical protein
MAKGLDWKGIPDTRPCSSGKSQSDSYTPSDSGRGEDFKGLEDARPASGTKSQSVNVGNGGK